MSRKTPKLGNASYHDDPPSKRFKPWHGIVKVQMAIGGEASVLIYSENRYIMAQFFAADYTTPEEQEAWNRIADYLVNEPVPKCYVNAERAQDGTLILKDKVEPQPW